MSGEYIRPDSAYMESMRVPASSRDVLNTSGLPREIALPYGLKFSAYLPVDHQANSRYLFEYRHGVALLGQMEGPVYVGLRGDGTVVLVDDEDPKPLFVNSSVPQFLLALSRFRSLIDHGLTCSWLADAISEIDPAAMSDDEYYWPTAIFDMGI